MTTPEPMVVVETKPAHGRRPLALAITLRLALLTMAAMVLISLLNRWNTFVTIPFTGDTSTRMAKSTAHVREVEFSAADGTRLYGWVMGKDSARYRMIYCKGQGGYVGHLLGITVGQCVALDTQCLVFDYRGYNRSAGLPSEAGTYDDARGAWLFATRELGWDGRKLVIWGQSLGGAVAIKLARDLGDAGAKWPEKARANVCPPSCLVVECAFSSIADMAQHRMGFLGAPQWLAFCGYDNVTRASGLKVPVFHVHGRKDEIVPFAFAERLDAALPQPKKTLWLDDAMHNDVWAVGQDELKPALLEFFAEHAANGGS